MAVWLLLPVFGKVAGEQEEAAQVDGDTEASARLSAAMVVMVLPVLAATGWGIFKYSLKLPLGPFFSAMALLMALLAIIFAGQGIAALQEAGAVSASQIPFFTLRILGIHPTLETLGAQALAAAIVAAGMLASAHRAQPGAEAKT